MTADGATEGRPQGDSEFDHAELESIPLRTRITGKPMMRGIIDVTMVGLVGGGPRLAMRAARVMLEENYSSEGRQHHGRRRGAHRRA